MPYISTVLTLVFSCGHLSETKTEKADENVFCTGSNSISVEQIRPHLLKHMAESDS